MTNEEFCNRVMEKLERLRREQEREERLQELLRRLSEPDLNNNEALRDHVQAYNIYFDTRGGYWTVQCMHATL